jgi:flagellar FliL protein
MSEEAAAPEGAEVKKKGLPPFVMPLVLALVGLGSGGFVGAKVVGPKLTAGMVKGLTLDDVKAHAGKKKAGSEDGDAHGEGDTADGEEAAADGAKEGEHGPPTAPPLYTIADLVLNPAGSGGTRFLMLSVAFDMKDSASVELIKLRDAEIKDAVLALVGAKTVEQLAEVSSREPMKLEINELVSKIIKKKKLIKRVSFPQFVIQ